MGGNDIYLDFSDFFVFSALLFACPLCYDRNRENDSRPGGIIMRIDFGGKSPLLSSCPLHTHATWEILALISGGGTITFGDGTVESFGPYSVICVPPNMPHTESSAGVYQNYCFRVTDFPLPDTSAPILLTDDAGHTIRTLMGLLYPLLHRGGQETLAKPIEHLVDALEEFLLLRARQTPPDIRTGQVIRLLTQNMSDAAFHIDRALTESGYCPDHIRRLFRAETGKTPREYLIDLRIRAAKRLLLLRRQSYESLDAVAEACGFSDAAYFSRVFKARVGIAPSAYADKTAAERAQTQETDSGVRGADA